MEHGEIGKQHQPSTGMELNVYKSIQECVIIQNISNVKGQHKNIMSQVKKNVLSKVRNNAFSAFVPNLIDLQKKLLVHFRWLKNNFIVTYLRWNN